MPRACGSPRTAPRPTTTTSFQDQPSGPLLLPAVSRDDPWKTAIRRVPSSFRTPQRHCASRRAKATRPGGPPRPAGIALLASLASSTGPSLALSRGGRPWAGCWPTPSSKSCGLNTPFQAAPRSLHHCHALFRSTLLPRNGRKWGVYPNPSLLQGHLCEARSSVFSSDAFQASVLQGSSQARGGLVPGPPPSPAPSASARPLKPARQRLYPGT